MSANNPTVLRERLRGFGDAEIDEALAGADPLALLGAVYVLTGDERLRGIQRAPQDGESWERPRPPEIEDDEGLASLRARAADLVRSFRDGTAAPEPPTVGRFRAAAEVVFAEPVPDRELELWWEEFAVSPVPRAVEPVRGDAAGFRVLVIGGGMNGITAGVVLQGAGIDFTIVEREPDVGGTWQRNNYPGARVDVESRIYSYSYDPDYHWNHHYALRDELTAYFRHVVDRFELRDRIRLQTEVVSARWDDSTQVWEVALRGPDGVFVERVNALVSAVGLFNRAKMPDIPGLETFGGTVMHTTAWDHSYDLAGKRVGLIGTGASGTQLVSSIVPVVDSLTIFQRSGTWISNLRGYTDPVSATDHWLIDHVPYYVNWMRVLSFYSIGDKRLPVYDLDPTWDDPLSVSAVNAKMRRQLVAYLEEKLAGRPDLVAKCTPSFPVLAKRMPKDNGWFDALRRDNVELVLDAIERVTPQGVVTESGATFEFDLLIVATGFATNDFLWPIRVEGRAGRSLADAWSKDGPRAYLGITIPGFPNLFCMYGPNTNPKAGGICTWGELQMRYITTCLKRLIEGGHHSVDVLDEVCRAYNERLDAELEPTVWMASGQRSYYHNDFGRSVTQAPWATVDYWHMTREPDFDDYVVT